MPLNWSHTRKREEYETRRAIVMQMLQDGLTYYDVGYVFGISDGAVGIIVRRKLKDMPVPNACQKCGIVGKTQKHHVSYVPEVIEHLCIVCHENEHREHHNTKNWATRYVISGESRTLTEWARVSGISRATLHARLRAGWPVECLTEKSWRHRIQPQLKLGDKSGVVPPQRGPKYINIDKYKADIDAYLEMRRRNAPEIPNSELRIKVLKMLQSGMTYSEVGEQIGKNAPGVSSVVSYKFKPLRNSATCSKDPTHKGPINFHHVSYWPEVVVPVCKACHNEEHKHDLGQRNAENARRYTFNGETRTIDEWAAIIGISRATFEKRIKKGWSHERIFNKPYHTSDHFHIVELSGEKMKLRDAATKSGISYDKFRYWIKEGRTVDQVIAGEITTKSPTITIDGKRDTLANFAREYHLSPSTIHARLRYGWTIEQAIKTPCVPHKKWGYGSKKPTLIG